MTCMGPFTVQSSRHVEQLLSFRLTGVGGQLLAVSYLK